MEEFPANPLPHEFRQDPKVIKPEEFAVTFEGVIGNTPAVLDCRPGFVLTDIFWRDGQQRQPDLNPLFRVVPVTFGGNRERGQFRRLFRYCTLDGCHF